MRTLILLFPLFFVNFFAAAQNEGPYSLRFAFTGNTAPLMNAHRQYQLADLIDKDSVTFTVVAGNVTSQINAQQQAILEEQWDKFMLLRERLTNQLFLVPGKDDLRDTLRYPLHPENENNRLYYAIENKPYLFLFLNTTNRQNGSHSLDTIQQQWLINILKAYSNSSVPVLFMHHPVWQEQNSPFTNQVKPLLQKFPRAYFFASNGMKDVYREVEGNLHYFGFANSESRMGYFLVKTGIDGEDVNVEFRDQGIDVVSVPADKKKNATFTDIVTSQVFLVGAFAGLVVAGIFILILLKMKR